MSEPTTFDAIVIGSGITGGWAAKELTEKGLKTLVLEAGRSVVPEEDYVEHVPQWEMKFRGMGDRRKLADEQPIQSACYACDEWSSKFFIKDKEHPYATDPGKPFRWPGWRGLPASAWHCCCPCREASGSSSDPSSGGNR